VGFNYIMASAQAALGLSQLERFDEFLGRKRAIAARYAEAFDAEPTIAVPREADWAFASHWLYTIHVPAGVREALIDSLAEDGIETRPIFECMHRVIAHKEAQADDCPVAEGLSDTGICLPCSTDLGDPELDEVAGAVLSALAVADVDRC
jgi:perosamine synthetase